MNVIALERLTPFKNFPWFDDYRKSNTTCKIYNDGGNYIAYPSCPSIKKKSDNVIRPLKEPIDKLFDELYSRAMKENVSRSDLYSFILSGLEEKYSDRWGLSDYVKEKIERTRRNLALRKKRFRRKAFLNNWNYFVTFTYDDERQDDESFRKRLLKCLSNLHTRRGWLVMGVFENAPETGRLHFHAIMHIPDGQMVGNIEERRDYSIKKHRMQTAHVNDFFERKFGRNDFAELSEGELNRGSTLSYLLKYLEKSGEKIFYSRGIPTEFIADVNDEDIICEMQDFIVKYVLFNDSIDYEVDVLKHKVNTEFIIFAEDPLPS